MTPSARQLFVALAFAGAATAAAASTVHMRFDSAAIGRSSIGIKHNGQNLTVFAGAMRHSFANGTGDAAVLNGQILTFCTELSQYASKSVWRTDGQLVSVANAPSPGVPMGGQTALALKEIWAEAGAAKFANAYMAEAVQIMIWELATDGLDNFNLGIGNFQLRDSMRSTAQVYFNQLANAIGSGDYEAGLRAVVTSAGQDQLVVIPVPLPGAAALALCGCGLVAVPRRRRAL